MSAARVPVAEALRLDAGTPIHVTHAIGPLTLAVVSIAWLGSLGDDIQSVATEHAVDPRAELGTVRRTRWLEWLGGRIAAKSCVAAYRLRHEAIRISPAQVHVRRVTTGPFAGRPFVQSGPELGISHSGAFAVAVAAPRPVGVDLEHRRAAVWSRGTYAEIAGEVAPGIRAMPPILQWACKEAILKRLGVGLRFGLDAVSLTRWRSDGSFDWQPSSALTPLGLTAEPGSRHGSWAGLFGEYAAALVWR